MNEIITKDNERIKGFFQSLERMLDKIEGVATNHRPTLNGERFLTDKEVSQRLRISRRSLQDYRTNGQIPYIQLGGKVLYRESDIQKMLDEGYKESFRKQFGLKAIFPPKVILGQSVILVRLPPLQRQGSHEREITEIGREITLGALKLCLNMTTGRLSNTNSLLAVVVTPFVF